MFNAQRYNPATFTEGVWTDIMGGQFKVARAGNPEYDAALERSGYRKIDDPEKKQRALFRSIAEAILRDWSGVVDAHGDEIPYTTPNAVDVLAENPDLVNRILHEANDLTNFRREDVESQGKPPRASSGGKRSGSGGS